MMKFLLLLPILFIQVPLLAADSKPVTMTCATSSCHDNLTHFPQMHRPMKAKGCTVCHQVEAKTTSASNKHPLLKKIGPENANKTCRVCHDEMVQGHMKFAHGVIEKKSCVACHNPHGSEHAHLLRQKTPDLCLKCHEGKSSVLNFGHSPIFNSAKSCLTCHASHYTNEESLLRGPVAAICLKCHEKEQKSPKGTTIAAIGQIMKTRPVKHKPVAEGKCSSCHDPHGSEDEFFLMDTPLPPTYKLCVSCHKKAFMEDEKTDKSTQFRNGTTNLHFLHLKNGKNGPRACSTCHEVHAANQPHMIRDELEAFGQNLPFKIKQNQNGATCTTACHGNRSYDRVQAVENPKER